MFSVTEALSETGYLWLMRSLSPLSKRGGSDGSEGLCPAPSRWGPVDTFAQKVVVCVLETGPPLQGRPGDSTGPSADMQRQLRLHKEPAQGPARCARPVSAFSLALESGLLALGLFRHLQN